MAKKKLTYRTVRALNPGFDPSEVANYDQYMGPSPNPCCRSCALRRPCETTCTPQKPATPADPNPTKPNRRVANVARRLARGEHR